MTNFLHVLENISAIRLSGNQVFPDLLSVGKEPTPTNIFIFQVEADQISAVDEGTETKQLYSDSLMTNCSFCNLTTNIVFDFLS